MGATLMIAITISLDGAASLNPCYRIDCSRCGAVDKAYGRDVIERAKDHNMKAHGNRGWVNIPAELSGKRYF